MAAVMHVSFLGPRCSSEFGSSRQYVDNFSSVNDDWKLSASCGVGLEGGFEHWSSGSQHTYADLSAATCPGDVGVVVSSHHK